MDLHSLTKTKSFNQHQLLLQQQSSFNARHEKLAPPHLFSSPSSTSILLLPSKLMRSVSSTFFLLTSPKPASTYSSSSSEYSSPSQQVSRTHAGPPTSHWRSDTDTAACAQCTVRFSFRVRRHHCRKCGDIFCNLCSAFQIRLDQALQFDFVNGVLVRVCKSCFHQADRSRTDPNHLRIEVEQLREHKIGLERQRNDSILQSAVATGSIPIAAESSNIPNLDEDDVYISASVSMPKWSWSTF